MSLSPRTFISTNDQICPYLYLREAAVVSGDVGSEIANSGAFRASVCVHSIQFVQDERGKGELRGPMSTAYLGMLLL